MDTGSTERNGKKVAVVGGGPSGLSCAYYLVFKGLFCNSV